MNQEVLILVFDTELLTIPKLIYFYFLANIEFFLLLPFFSVFLSFKKQTKYLGLFVYEFILGCVLFLFGVRIMLDK